MKFYEVRKHNNKVFPIEFVFEHEIDITNFMEEESPGFYTIKFNDKTKQSETRVNLINNKIYVKHNKYPRFRWIITDSDHRKDVRIVKQDVWDDLHSGKSKYIICKSCDHIFSDYPISLDKTYIKATKAYHKLGDVSREKEDYAVISEADGDNYYGNWIEGFGFINVRFPKETSRIVDKPDG